MVVNVKIACLNLWRGGLLFDDIIDFLKGQAADILMLQEVYNGAAPTWERKFRSIDALQEELSYPHVAFAPAMIDVYSFGKVVQGNAVLSKFPIKNTRVVFYNEPFGERDPEDINAFPVIPRNLQHVALDCDGVEVNIFNTQGVWDLNGDNYSPLRQKMSQKIIESVKNKKNVVFAGDTNARPTNQAMRNIEAYLNSVFDGELKTSFNLRRKDLKKYPGYAESVVDLMYVSPDVKVINHDCPNVDVSDHLPLTATLRFS